MQNYKVGLYLRLSRDDKNSDSESMSISNQKAILTEYVNERGWSIEDIYIDDGFSGVTFERPSFQRMVSDIKAYRINMVIVKDLSRLGRNYVKVGEYTEFFFPKHNVRFIAVGENIDSDKENDIAGFLNVVYEHYVKDVSRKVKVVKANQMKKGQFIGSQPAMGYMRDPEDKHHLIIEEDGAEIIRRIFRLYILGNSARHIAEMLNGEEVPTPRVHFFNRLGKINPYTNDSNQWGSATITSILKNQVYIGHMMQGKRQKKNFKLKKRNVIPRENWVVVKNTHDPLIDEITWAKAQEIFSRNKRKIKPKLKADKTVALFSNKLICADCGAVMTYTYSKNGNYKAYYKYRCSTYNNQGKSACSYHSIREDELEIIVLNEMRKFSKIAVSHTDKLVSKLIEINNKIKNKSNEHIERKARKTEKELQLIKQKVDVLLSQMVSGNISEAMFRQYMGEYEAKQLSLNEDLIKLKSEISNGMTDTNNIKNLVQLFKNREYIEKLDRDTVVDLIDYIEVFKKEKVGKEYFQRIDIHFNFIGQISAEQFQTLKTYIQQQEENRTEVIQVI